MALNYGTLQKYRIGKKFKLFNQKQNFLLKSLKKTNIMILKNYLSKNLRNSHIKKTVQDNLIISTYSCFTPLTLRLSHVDFLSRYVK